MVRARITGSHRKRKQLKAEFFYKGRKHIVHFGDPSMREYPGTKRGDSYCARSYGIKGRDDPLSPNYWSRRVLWRCRGKRSVRR